MDNEDVHFWEAVAMDLERYAPGCGLWHFLRAYFIHVEFRYLFWFRAAGFSRRVRSIRPIHYLCRWILYRKQIRYGIDIAYNTSIKPGFYIGHIGGIVVHYRVRIGSRCNISTGVVIGESQRGKRAGIPEIGDGVYIGPGAKIIGKVKVGNRVAIGANCVVTKDVPERAVVVGVPGTVISFDGAEGYIEMEGVADDRLRK